MPLKLDCWRLTDIVFSSTTEGRSFSDTDRVTVCRFSATARELAGIMTALSCAYTKYLSVNKKKEKKAIDKPKIAPISTRLNIKMFLEDSFCIIFMITPHF
jgi:hypothetical protein